MPSPSSISQIIHVCPLSALEQTTRNARATHLISVINPWSLPETPSTISSENHLKLGMNDIAEPQMGLIAPGAEHIDSLVAFGRNWNKAGPLVIHCLAGVSRSTAAAYILLCVINPEADERVVAKNLRAASPAASPNRRMIRLADTKLSRNGRMIKAVDWIGEGQPVGENLPFALPTNIV
ncbi:MAG: tyrosine phosphatase family protein [Hyphomicrobiaceae bacterium]